MTTAALAYPFLDGPSTQAVCHIDDGTERSNLCLAPDHPGFVTCETPGLRFVECPDCGLPVCGWCLDLAFLKLGVGLPPSVSEQHSFEWEVPDA